MSQHTPIAITTVVARREGIVVLVTVYATPAGQEAIATTMPAFRGDRCPTTLLSCVQVWRLGVQVDAEGIRESNLLL